MKPNQTGQHNLISLPYIKATQNKLYVSGLTNSPGDQAFFFDMPHYTFAITVHGIIRETQLMHIVIASL